MARKYSNAPKRRIERIRNRINDLITSTASGLTLHTAEDAKTLVRTIIDLKVNVQIASAATFVYDMLMQLNPNGVTIFQPSVAQLLDDPLPINMIWEDSGSLNVETVVGDYNIIHIKADLKSQRKMKENDTLVLAHIANVANAFQLSGYVTLFFKE